MSNFPTIEKSFETLLNSIITLKPPDREAIVKPALQAFTSHPLIQSMLQKEEAHLPKSSTSKTLDLSEIQKTLTALSKVLEGIQKPLPSPSKRQPPSPSQQGQSQAPPLTLTPQ